MDLKIFFSPLDEELFTHITAPNSFIKNIKANIDRMPDYRGADIAIFGVEEERGAESNIGTAQGPTAIRQKLYALKKGYGAYKIVDLGNLRLGIDLDETHGRIKEVCQILIEQNVMPVILGGSHDLDYGQFKGYEGMEKLISVLNVDAYLDMEEGIDAPMNTHHVHNILIHEPNYLFHYTHLGYQSYLVDQNLLQILEKLYFESHRLGQLRNDFKEIEPIIRNADMLSFDVSAIKSADAPATAFAQPFGLTGEEACQICWYAGLNEKLSSAGFYEYNPVLDDDNMKTASVVATMVWYFIEGFYHRKNELKFKTNDYTRFVVSMPSDPETISFFKSKLSEKWWMEVPISHSYLKYDRNIIIPCSYEDYKVATSGEVPDRFVHAQAKMV